MSLYTELKIRSDVKNDQWLEALPFYEKITKALTENGFYTDSKEKLTAINIRFGRHVDCIIADIFFKGEFYTDSETNLGEKVEKSQELLLIYNKFTDEKIEELTLYMAVNDDSMHILLRLAERFLDDFTVMYRASSLNDFEVLENVDDVDNELSYINKVCVFLNQP